MKLKIETILTATKQDLKAGIITPHTLEVSSDELNCGVMTLEARVPIEILKDLVRSRDEIPNAFLTPKEMMGAYIFFNLDLKDALILGNFIVSAANNDLKKRGFGFIKDPCFMA